MWQIGKYWEDRTETGEKSEEHRPVLTEEQHSLPEEKRLFCRQLSKCDTLQSRFGHAIKGWTGIGI